VAHCRCYLEMDGGRYLFSTWLALAFMWRVMVNVVLVSLSRIRIVCYYDQWARYSLYVRLYTTTKGFASLHCCWHRTGLISKRYSSILLTDSRPCNYSISHLSMKHRKIFFSLSSVDALDLLMIASMIRTSYHHRCSPLPLLL